MNTGLVIACAVVLAASFLFYTCLKANIADQWSLNTNVILGFSVATIISNFCVQTNQFLEHCNLESDERWIILVLQGTKESHLYRLKQVFHNKQ